MMIKLNREKIFGMINFSNQISTSSCLTNGKLGSDESGQSSEKSRDCVENGVVIDDVILIENGIFENDVVFTNQENCD